MTEIRNRTSEQGNSNSYRTRLYERYGAHFQDADSVFDVRAADRWGDAYSYYLRGWMPLSKDADIADLACGGGRLLRFFVKRGYTAVTGVDISADQVTLSKQVTPNVVQKDVLEFLGSSRSEALDLVIALDLVEHFSKDEALAFLDQCRRVLRAKGRLILQTPNAGTPWGLEQRYNDFTHEIAFNPNALTRLMRLVGFVDVNSREKGPIPYGYSLPSTVRFIAWQCIRGALQIRNLAETGNRGHPVLTRVFFATGSKPE
jgi:SAM-dependent methyltransferase